MTKKKLTTMFDVFYKLPRGYWRNSELKTMALKDMDNKYLRSVRKFLSKKRDIYRFMESKGVRYKLPKDLDYVMKILEIGAEIKRRQEAK